MKLITLNSWGGRVHEPLINFLSAKSDIDIWCFQEIFNAFKNREPIEVPGYTPDIDLFKTLTQKLNAHKGIFCPTEKDHYGIASFLRQDIEIMEFGETFVARGNWDDTSDLANRDHHRKLQWIEIKLGEKKLLIANTHLTHRPAGKLDSEKRINQSKTICHFLSLFDCPKILCGDFNLLPDTESIKMIEDAGMRNLIKEYGITSTRTRLYTKPLPFADYIFVSNDIEIKNFQVLPDEVSDHSPLLLDFEI